MKRFFVLIVLIICSLASGNLYSQELHFASTTFDFGTIAEDGGVVSTIFEYKNGGDKPAVIVTVDSSCGCTVPTYSKQPIVGGASSSIEVTFDPMGRVGKFSKTIQVLVAPENKIYVLTITGDVTPRSRTAQERYPFEMGGGLRFAANYYPLSLVAQGESVEVQVSYVNLSKKEVKPTFRFLEKSGVLEVRDFPLAVAPGEESFFTVSYNLEGRDGLYGELSDKLAIKVNGRASKYNLMTTAHAVDKFSDDFRAAPPVFTAGSRTVRIGEVKGGEQSSKSTFVVENTGVVDMVVRSAQTGEDLHSSLKGGEVVAAGEKINIDVWFDARKGDYGTFSRYLTLTVNDPDAPVQRVRFAGTIVK